ncbi:MAG: hypothetical protein KC609_14685 [Myxococcales bacterium]|nr:hypothetical protein [Myxococcales bacterium]
MRSDRYSPILWPFLWLAIAIAFLFPIFSDWQSMGGWDQTYFHAFDETARRTVLDYGQFPAWNPYHCGGRTLIGHVASTHMHPLFWLVALPLGTGLGFKIYLLLHIFLGVAGMHLYMRERGAEDLGALVAATAFGACGYFSWHFAGGHVSYYGLTLTPLILLFLERGRHKARYGVWVGLLLAWTFLLGGAYAYPFQVLLVGAHVIYYSVADRSPTAFYTAAIAGLVSLGVSAVKVLPVLEFTLKHSRPSQLLESIAPWELFEPLLSRRSHFGRWGNHPFTWPEYGSYIGYLPLLLAMIAAARQTTQRRYYVGMAIFFLLLVLGNHGPYSPYALLRKLPVYKDLRVPSRYLIFVVFYLAALAGFAVSAWRRELTSRFAAHQWRYYLPHATALLVILELCSFGQHEFRRTYNIKPVPLALGESFDQWVVGRPEVESYLGPYRNVGIVNCYEEGANPRSPHLRRGKVPQVFLERVGDGKIDEIRVTPNQITFRATLERESVVLINENVDSGWRIGDQKAFDVRGLIAFRLPAGERRYRAVYRPRSMVIGICLTSTFMLGIVFFFVGLARRQRTGWRATLFP